MQKKKPTHIKSEKIKIIPLKLQNGVRSANIKLHYTDVLSNKLCN